MEALTNEHVRVELGRRLRAVRLTRNLTQAQVGKAAGVDRKAVSRMERGLDASLDSFLGVLRALGLLDRLTDVIPADVASPIDALEGPSRSRRRQRARPAMGASTAWQWGDER